MIDTPQPAATAVFTALGTDRNAVLDEHPSFGQTLQ